MSENSIYFSLRSEHRMFNSLNCWKSSSFSANYLGNVLIKWKPLQTWKTSRQKKKKKSTDRVKLVNVPFLVCWYKNSLLFYPTKPWAMDRITFVLYSHSAALKPAALEFPGHIFFCYLDIFAFYTTMYTCLVHLKHDRVIAHHKNMAVYVLLTKKSWRIRCHCRELRIAQDFSFYKALWL